MEEHFAAILERPKTLVHMAQLGQGEPARMLERLALEVRVPVLVMHGADDRLVPIAHAVNLYRAMRRAGVPVELARIADAGHMLPFFAPEEVGRRLQTFHQQVKGERTTE